MKTEDQPIEIKELLAESKKSFEERLEIIEKYFQAIERRLLSQIIKWSKELTNQEKLQQISQQEATSYNDCERVFDDSDNKDTFSKYFYRKPTNGEYPKCLKF